MKLPLYLSRNNKYYPKFGKRIIKERYIPDLDYKRIKSNRTKSTVVFLEPHSDDVAFSISGSLYNLYKRGHKIVIITFFSRTPPKKSPWNKLFSFNEEDYESIRKIENISAFKFLLDCKLKFLNLKSSKYRGYGLFFQKPKERDTAIQMIQKEFNKLKIKFPKSRIFVPAGIGNHVDHVLIRDLAIKHLKNLFFYEEYPYCTKKKYSKQGIEKLKKIGAKAVVEKINIKIKNKLINLYNSQLKINFYKNESKIKSYFGNVAKNKQGYYERYWRLQEK